MLVIIFNLFFVFCRTLLHNIKFFYFHLNCFQVCFNNHQIGFYKQRIVSMGLEKPINRSLKIFIHKTQGNVDFSGRLELVEDFSNLLFIYFTTYFEILVVTQLMFQFSTSLCSRKCCKHYVPPSNFHHSPRLPLQSCSNPLKFHLVCVVLLHVAFSDVFVESISSQTHFQDQTSDCLEIGKACFLAT